LLSLLISGQIRYFFDELLANCNQLQESGIQYNSIIPDQTDFILLRHN